MYYKSNKANLSLASDNIIAKEDKPGLKSVAWEAKFYQHLEASRLNIAPKYKGYEEGILYIEKINNGATIRDYVQGYVQGIVPLDILTDILIDMSKMLRAFWDADYVHNDLHSMNVIIGCEFKDKWRSHIIDFGISLHEELKLDFTGEFPQLMEILVCNRENDKKRLIGELIDYGLPNNLIKLIA